MVSVHGRPIGECASAAASASRSEPEYAAKSPVDIVHERCRRVADRFLKVGLIEGDEGGDVDDRVLGEAGDGRGQEAGYKAVNARTSWDAGVVYGYGTDTNYDPKAGLEHELKSLNLMFSMQDIIKLMGPNTASYIQMSDQLGTLEPGKLADLVLLDGNPLEGYWNFLNTKVVLKGGVVVVDKR